ncbi:MAG: hypothetical protein GWN30_05165, partial [Gammaproteobacteria bacterium]|nr:hypothetical protein [Gammaproteobacteria bacterium]
MEPTSYSWEFVPVAGETFTDTGTANCVTPAAGDIVPPTLVNNTGSSLLEGGTDPIPNTELQYSDEQPASSINFSVTSGPANGQLELTSNPNNPISSFTQADIDSGLLVYIHDDSNTTSDQFGFNVDDSQGNVVTGQSFNFSITPVDDDAPTLVNNT